MSTTRTKQIVEMQRALLPLGVAVENREYRPSDDGRLDLGAGIEADDRRAVMHGVVQHSIRILHRRVHHDREVVAEGSRHSRLLPDLWPAHLCRVFSVPVFLTRRMRPNQKVGASKSTIGAPPERSDPSRHE